MADVCWVIVLFFPLSLWRGEGWERGQSPSMVGSKLERYPLFGPFLLKEKEPSLCRDIHRLQSREPRHHWRMRNCARWQALYRFSHIHYMDWRGSAATAQNVQLHLLNTPPPHHTVLLGHY